MLRQYEYKVNKKFWIDKNTFEISDHVENHWKKFKANKEKWIKFQKNTLFYDYDVIDSALGTTNQHPSTFILEKTGYITLKRIIDNPFDTEFSC